MNQRNILLLIEWHDERFERGVARYAREHRWRLSLDPLFYGRIPWGWQGDGGIGHLITEEGLRFVRELGKPVVDVGYTCEYDGPRLHCDDWAIGRQAADYFIDRGFQNFAWYSQDTGPVGDARSSSYVEQIQKHGYSCCEVLWKSSIKFADASWEERHCWLTQHLAKLPKPIALFCIDDRMSAHAAEVCVDTGIRIPEDIAILGVGNLVMACECSPIPLSTIPTRAEFQGYEAAALLDRVLDGEPVPPEPIIVPPAPVLERASTRTIACTDPIGQQLVSFLFEHYPDQIGVDDMAATVGLNRRQLNYLCRKQFAEGPAHLLERIRLEHAKRMLADLDEKVEMVATQCGYNSSLALNRSFQRNEGCSPTAWRQSRA